MAEDHIPPRLDYTNSRDDIAELYQSGKNDSRDYGPRARVVVESAGVEIVPEDETPTEQLDSRESISDTTPDTTPEDDTDTDEDAPVQLQLLPEPRNVPLRFKLSRETRETGLREIQKIREQYFDNKDE
jgi:hypothetical protein